MRDSLSDHSPLILLADEYPGIREVLKQLLNDEGYHVLTASDGMEALELARHSWPDIILIDDGLPRLTGAELCRLYREEGGAAPVVLVSAGDPEVITATVEACGAVAFIAKPFDVDEVLDTIARLTGQSSPGGD